MRIKSVLRLIGLIENSNIELYEKEWAALVLQEEWARVKKNTLELNKHQREYQRKRYQKIKQHKMNQE